MIPDRSGMNDVAEQYLSVVTYKSEAVSLEQAETNAKSWNRRKLLLLP